MEIENGQQPAPLKFATPQNVRPIGLQPGNQKKIFFFFFFFKLVLLEAWNPTWDC